MEPNQRQAAVMQKTLLRIRQTVSCCPACALFESLADSHYQFYQPHLISLPRG